jgi:hypothetical protein
MSTYRLFLCLTSVRFLSLGVESLLLELLTQFVHISNCLAGFSDRRVNH